MIPIAKLRPTIMGTSYEVAAENPLKHSVGLPIIAPRGMNSSI